MDHWRKTQLTASARQDIEYLQRLYARATDLIATNTDESVAEGRALYNRIFTPNVAIRTAGSDGEPLVSRGPDGWADIVLQALADYSTTQHLIGTQIAQIDQLDVDEDGNIVTGEAQMESYLQATHENEAAGTVWAFHGIYADKVRFTPGSGWQIHDMTLTRMSSETRPLGVR